MNKIFLLTLPIFALAGVLFFLSSTDNNRDKVLSEKSEVVQNGDTQEIEILAKGGYSPREINAKSGIKTLLKIKTQNTYDCSAALSIPKLGIREILDSNNIRTFEIDPQEKGSEIQGTCQMGMYGFKINFQ
ncbi:cupredoxin domain-containing protein [Patescibacteria group bacterium]|nr:cupredoxin domain-containing protein [Patescibacteria group bacterium]